MNIGNMHPQFIFFLIVFCILLLGVFVFAFLLLVMLVHAFNGMGFVSKKQLVSMQYQLTNKRFKRMFMLFSTVIFGVIGFVFFYYQNLIFHFWTFTKASFVGTLYGVLCGFIYGFFLPRAASRMHAYLMQSN